MTIQRLIALCIVAIAAAGCGGGTTESSDPRPAPDAAGRRACDLITAAEAGAILGNTVTARNESPSTCVYEGDDGQQVRLTAHWTGGQQQWEVKRTGRDFARNLLSDAAPQLGDRSSFSPIVESLVLKGDVLLEFRLNVAGDARPKWEALARTALQRL